jgi:HSP20 family protein
MVFRCVNPTHTNRIEQEMNRLLSTFFGETPSTRSAGSRSAAANVWEKDDGWLIEMELPGVAPEHLDISVMGDELSISAERPETEEEGVTYYRHERPRSFSRTLQLPTAVDAERVEAALVHGVLTVTLPKSEAARRRKIEVQPGG